MYLYALVFFFAVVVDYFYAKWSQSVTEKKALAASFWSVGIILSGGFNIIQYSHDFYTLIPASLGAFIGTYISVWRNNK